MEPTHPTPSTLIRQSDYPDDSYRHTNHSSGLLLRFPPIFVGGPVPDSGFSHWLCLLQVSEIFLYRTVRAFSVVITCDGYPNHPPPPDPIQPREGGGIRRLLVASYSVNQRLGAEPFGPLDMQKTFIFFLYQERLDLRFADLPMAGKTFVS